MIKILCIKCLYSEFDKDNILRCHLNPPQSVNWTQEEMYYGELRIYSYQEFQFPIIKEDDWCKFGVKNETL